MKKNEINKLTKDQAIKILRHQKLSQTNPPNGMILPT